MSASAANGSSKPGTSNAAVTEGRMATYRRKAGKAIAEFFGVEKDVRENRDKRWIMRRRRIAGTMGSGVQKTESPDEVDSKLSRRTPGQTSSKVAPRDEEDGIGIASFLSATLSALRSVSRTDARGKSDHDYSSGEKSDYQSDRYRLVDDLFFDVYPISSISSRPDRAGPNNEVSSPRWRRRPQQMSPSTADKDFTDGRELGLKRIKERVVNSTMRRDKREVGQGIVNRLLGQKLKKSFVVTKQVRKQMDKLNDHRPFFTYWVTFVQVVIFIVSCAVYGLAPVGISTTEVVDTVRMPNLLFQREVYEERENLWIGPRQADLIHLGAKYSPCMRKDENLNKAIDLDIAVEKETACCIRNDGSGCVQSVESGCDPLLATWDKWNGGLSSPDQRTSGSVCGQDPRYCTKPASSPPYEWPDDITKWPLCTDTATIPDNVTENNNVDCQISGRPCCVGIQAECIITTKDNCDLKRGYYHDEAYLCSQVKCLEDICGMIPFTDADTPDQFYRLWTSLFLHGGLVHLALTMLFQLWIMRDLEKLMGALRVSIIYLGAGVAGNLASCTFIPYQVEAGPSGAQFGIVSCLLVEVIQSYQIYQKPWRAVLKLVLPLLLLFFLGLLPWFDNWAHLFGFLFGFMLAFALVPYVSFGDFDRRRKIISIIACLGTSIGIFVILVIIFYVAPISDCDWCIYFNCIPFTDDFCDNMAMKIRSNSTYA